MDDARLRTANGGGPLWPVRAVRCVLPSEAVGTKWRGIFGGGFSGIEMILLRSGLESLGLLAADFILAPREALQFGPVGFHANRRSASLLPLPTRYGKNVFNF